MEAVITESEASTDFDFAMEVQDAMYSAEAECLGNARKAVVYADCPNRLIETHYFQTMDGVNLAIAWGHHVGYQCYSVGADILENA